MTCLNLNREERELVTWAERRGWTVLRRNHASHLVLRFPNGAQRPVPREFDGYSLMRATRSKLEKLERLPEQEKGRKVCTLRPFSH